MITINKLILMQKGNVHKYKAVIISDIVSQAILYSEPFNHKLRETQNKTGLSKKFILECLCDNSLIFSPALKDFMKNKSSVSLIIEIKALFSVLNKEINNNMDLMDYLDMFYLN